MGRGQGWLEPPGVELPLPLFVVVEDLVAILEEALGESGGFLSFAGPADFVEAFAGAGLNLWDVSMWFNRTKR